jgi:hypothetical protein
MCLHSHHSHRTLDVASNLHAIQVRQDNPLNLYGFDLAVPINCAVNELKPAVRRRLGTSGMAGIVHALPPSLLTFDAPPRSTGFCRLQIYLCLSRSESIARRYRDHAHNPTSSVPLQQVHALVDPCQPSRRRNTQIRRRVTQRSSQKAAYSVARLRRSKSFLFGKA